MKKIPGLILLVVGAALVYWGYNMSHSVTGQANNLLNGSPGTKPMLCYIGGVVLLLTGIGQITFKGK